MTKMDPHGVAGTIFGCLLVCLTKQRSQEHIQLVQFLNRRRVLAMSPNINPRGANMLIKNVFIPTREKQSNQMFTWLIFFY